MKAAEILEFLKSVFHLGKVDDVGKKRVPYALALVREKTHVYEKDKKTDKRGPLIETLKANRCQFNVDQTIISLRSQYIYQALRYAAKIIDDYEKKGPFSSRFVHWEKWWQEIMTSFDEKLNAMGWVQVYVDGHSYFKTKKNHFFEILEKCIMVGELKNYDDALIVAEDLFGKSGLPVSLQDETILTANIREGKDAFHCGFINVVASSDNGGQMMFSFKISKNSNNPPKFQQILTISADLIESMQLTARLAGYKKRVIADPDALSDEEIEIATEIRVRRNKLEARIDTAESIYEFKYRPERPILKQDDDFMYF